MQIIFTTELRGIKRGQGQGELHLVSAIFALVAAEWGNLSVAAYGGWRRILEYSPHF